MGLLFSRFRKEKTSLQQLEELQEEIETIECDKHNTVLKQKKYVGKLIIYSVLVYFIFAIIFYFLAVPSTLRDGALYIAPLVLIPVIVFAAQKFIKWYFSRKITWNTEKLADLRAKKKKILDEVMDKETFRKAREILEKFAPDQLRKSEGQGLKLGSSLKTSPSKNVEGKNELKKNENEMRETKPIEVVKRPGEISTQMTPQPAIPQSETSRIYSTYPLSQSTMTTTPLLPQSTSNLVLPPSQKRRLARPILDPVGSRGFVDRLIEHLVGDGPANRYALICSHCSSHNGMALKEEFEYISFRCAYCGFPNPSRKVMSKRNSNVSVQEQVEESNTTETGEAELSADSTDDSSQQNKLNESSESTAQEKQTDQSEKSLVPAEND